MGGLAFLACNPVPPCLTFTHQQTQTFKSTHLNMWPGLRCSRGIGPRPATCQSLAASGCSQNARLTWQASCGRAAICLAILCFYLPWSGVSVSTDCTRFHASSSNAVCWCPICAGAALDRMQGVEAVKHAVAKYGGTADRDFHPSADQLGVRADLSLCSHGCGIVDCGFRACASSPLQAHCTSPCGRLPAGSCCPGPGL